MLRALNTFTQDAGRGLASGQREVYLYFGVHFHGFPVEKVGLYFHCLTASMAAGASIGCPLTSERFWMEPSLPMTARRMTVPEMRAWRANGG